MNVNVTIHGVGQGMCSMSGHEEQGLTVSFEDSTVVRQFLSWESFYRLLRVKQGAPGFMEGMGRTGGESRSETKNGSRQHARS
jgi:hypothetical protein